MTTSAPVDIARRYRELAAIAAHWQRLLPRYPDQQRRIQRNIERCEAERAEIARQCPEVVDDAD